MSDMKTKIKVKVKGKNPSDALQGLKKAVAPLDWSASAKSTPDGEVK